MSVTTDVRSPSGARAGTVRLDDAVFGVTPNGAVLHQVVVAQLASARAGTQSTRTRAEVSGGGRKPWRQKGTGQARQGSRRAPHWRGGGVALGPKPRSYRQRTPKKMVQLALAGALSDRAASGNVVVVEGWDFTVPSTKSAAAALRALGTHGRVLVVIDASDENARKSFRNLPQVHVIIPGELNAYDILCADWVVFTRSNLPGVVTDTTAAPDTAPAASPAPGEQGSEA